MDTRKIPLFPLTLVLFPGMTLPLHIFEPRYKRMIKDVVQDDEPFGVVLSRESGIASIGCTAAVRRINRTYPDGRMDIIALGESAYHIRAIHKDREYLEATVDIMPEELRPGSADQGKELLTLYADCHLLLHGSPPGEVDDEEDALLAYNIASELPLELEVLQELLEMRSEDDRRAKLIHRLNQLLPQLIQIQQIRSKSATGGHFPN